MTVPAVVPAPPPPPPGPGVQPPFVAPPTDGARRRHAWSIGLGITFLVVVCLGGLVGAGVVIYLGDRAVGEESTKVVTDYLTAIQDQRYPDAFALLCDKEQTAGEATFERQQRNGPTLLSFTVGVPQVEASGGVTVPASLRYAVTATTATDRDVTFTLVQDASTGGFDVCGIG